MWMHADPKKPAALLWLETTHCTSEPNATSLYFWLLCLFSLADLVWTLETKDKRLSSCTDMGAHRIRFVHTSIFLLFIISWASQLHQVTIASGMFVWILLFWSLIPSTKDTMQIRIKTFPLVDLMTPSVIYFLNGIELGWYTIEPILWSIQYQQ